MQSLGKLTAGSVDYYVEQLRHSVGEDVPVLRGDRRPGRVDYYAGHDSPSRWMGDGLHRVGLEAGSDVDPVVFERLMNHTTPAGESMVRAHAKHGHIRALDQTFSAPKSVSLLYAFGDQQVRDQVREAHLEAVAEAVGYMQDRCSQSRVGTRYRGDGRWKVKTRTVDSEGYVAAGFDHFTSRANDPQLHTHVVVINRVWADNGWRAIDAKRSYAHLKAGGTVYQARLRQELTQRLGVRWRPVTNGQADVAGFSDELIRFFSTRRVEIEAAVERYVAETGKEAHGRVWQTFTLETRQPKSHPAGEGEVTREMKDYGVTADVLAHWHQLAQDAPEDVIALVQNVVTRGRESLQPSQDDVKEAAVKLTQAVAERQAVFTERDLVAHVAALFPDGTQAERLLATTRELLRTAQDAGEVLTVLSHRDSGLVLPEGVMLTPDELTQAADQGPGWIKQDGTVRFRTLPGEARYTTRLQLQREHQVLTAADESSPVRVDANTLDAAMTDQGLVAEQRRAMWHLAGHHSRLVAVVGPGGSGKTYAIGAYADALTPAGHPVVGVATSAAAARNLSQHLGEQWSGTIAMARHHLQNTNQPLGEGTVVIVDEASMVSTADLAWLVERVEACGGKLVLIGDPKQLPSIDSGGLFHRIVATGDRVIDDLANVNQRQRLDLDRQQLSRLHHGHVKTAVLDYHEAGRLHVGRDEYTTKAAMVDAWWGDSQQDGLEQVRMLASRHDEVAMLNQLARVRMHHAGLLHGPTLTNRWGVDFQAGDRIVVRDNWYRHRDIRNGQTGTITDVDPDTGSVTFSRDLDGELIDLPKRYVDRAVDHAYAQTIHTAQGQTFDTTHLYIDTGIRAEHGYTALSRARDETHLWINDTPGPLGECVRIDSGPPLEDHIDRLVRQLTRSVIEPPAADQGVPVAGLSDDQLVAWRDQLATTIGNGPLAQDVTDELAAFEEAIAHARELAARYGTSGDHLEVTTLEDQRDSLLVRMRAREQWLEDNSDLLYQYSAATEELTHRVNARVAAYEHDPPRDLLDALGPNPANPKQTQRWRDAAATYAEVRIAVGPDVDLTNPGIRQAPRWRDAVHLYHEPPTQQLTERVPVLGRAM